MTLATATSLDEWQRRHPGKRRCDVYRMYGAADCAGVSVAWFTASCGNGHVIEGTACSGCKNAAKTGCLPCWGGGAGYQPVNITWEHLEPVTP